MRWSWLRHNYLAGASCGFSTGVQRATFAFYEHLQGLRRAVRGIWNLSAELNQSVPRCVVVERPGPSIDQPGMDRFRQALRPKIAVQVAA